MGRAFKFAPGEYYHIYNRGVERRNIFNDEADKRRFQKLLYLCNGDRSLDLRELPEGEAFGNDVGGKLVDIGAYCLMTNHFHLLVHEKIEGGASAFMHKLGTSHTMYFNKKYDRTGALFEGAFKAKHVNKDNYLKYMFAYIHLNSADMIESKWKEKGIKEINKVLNFLEDYKYSSYQEYLKKNRPESSILAREAFPEYFETAEANTEELRSWLTFNED